jgi:hypothetical protein
VHDREVLGIGFPQVTAISDVAAGPRRVPRRDRAVRARSSPTAGCAAGGELAKAIAAAPTR